MDEAEIPQYFICPISLQMMKEPVTAVTGITYDRESIERWLLTAKDSKCPVTKQPLPRDSVLTPNHTLHRLIQAWRAGNTIDGVSWTSTQKSPLEKTRVIELVQDLEVPQLRLKALKRMESLALENERNRRCMEEAGAVKATASFIIRCFKEGRISGLEEALRILHLIWNPTAAETKLLVNQNYDFIESVAWVLQYKKKNHVVVKTQAMLVLKMIIEVANKRLLDLLKPEFFKEIMRVLRDKISQQAIKAALHVLIEICHCARNKKRIVEAGGVFELIELELEKPEKKITELIFCLLAHLCSCAEGREQFLGHAGGIAMVTKRLLRVSMTVDDRAVHVLALISKYSATNEVLLEMLRVAAVSKLCMVLQADCATYLKDKARGILRPHSNVWNNSPCIAVYLLTRYPR